MPGILRCAVWSLADYAVLDGEQWIVCVRSETCWSMASFPVCVLGAIAANLATQLFPSQ